MTREPQPRNAAVRAALIASLLLPLPACLGPRSPDSPSAAPFNAPVSSFVNGGFEDDAIGAAPSGWTVTAYRNFGLQAVPPTSMGELNLQAGGAVLSYVRGGAPESQVDPQAGAAATLRYPRYGQRAVDLNDPGANFNVNSLKQAATMGAGDVDPDDGQVHVRFVVAAVMDESGHPPSSQPYFYIEARNLTRGTVLFRDFNYGGQPGVPWKQQAGYLYKDWQLVDVTAAPADLVPGDSVELEIVASGCSGGGHALRAYVDGVGAAIDGLYATASAPAKIHLGEDIVYDVHFKNGSAVMVTGASVDLTPPPNTTFVSVTTPGGLTCTTPPAGGTGAIHCDLGGLAAGAGGSFQLALHVESGASGRLAIGDYWITATGVSPLYGTKVETQVVQPASLAVAAGGTQSAAVHSTFAQPLSVIVLDSDGAPYSGASVSFVANPAGDATAALSAPGVQSDAQGLASVTADASDIVGSYTVTAQVAGIAQAVTFTLTNVPGAPAAITAQPASTPQTAQVDTALAAPLSVLVHDAYRNLVPGATVRFAAPIAGATAVLSSATAQTDAAGLASVTAQAGRVAGAYAVTASVDGVGLPASFALVNQAGPPGKLAITGGDQQLQAVMTPFPQGLAVLVTDVFDNVLKRQPVTFRGPASGAAALLAGYTTLTNDSGEAAIGIGAGAVAGRYEVSASVPGVAHPVLFTLTNLPGQAASVRGEWTASNQCASLGSGFPLPLQATVLDAYLNPVPNVAVSFAADDLSVGLSAASRTTDAAGKASVTATAWSTADRPASAGAQPANVLVRASVDGVPLPARFQLQVGQDQRSPSPLLFAGGIGQATRVGEDFKSPLRVRVRSGGGAVIFAAPDSGPSAILSAREVTPDPRTGLATVLVKANGVAGTYVVKAFVADCSGGGGRIDFVLKNLPGAPASVQVDDVLATPQAAKVGGGFLRPLRVVVRDAMGNTVPDATVSFSAPAAGATAALDAATAQTGADGRAVVSALAGTDAGDFTVSAAVAGAADPARFKLTNLVSAPLSVEIGGGSQQGQQVYEAYGAPLLSVVRDATGAVKAGVPVAFSTWKEGRPSVALSAAEVQTDGEGRAGVTATANQSRGLVTVLASAPGAAAPVMFQLKNRPIATTTTLKVQEGLGDTREITAVVEAAGGSHAPAGQLLLYRDDASWAAADGEVMAADGLRSTEHFTLIERLGAHRYEAIFLPLQEGTDRGPDTFLPSASAVARTEVLAPQEVTPPYDPRGCTCSIGTARQGAGAPPWALAALGMVALGVRAKRRRRR